MFCSVEASTHLGAWCTLGALLWQVGLVVVPPLWGLVWVWWYRKKLAEEEEKRRVEELAKRVAEVQRVEREKAMVAALEDIQQTARCLLAVATQDARATTGIIDLLKEIKKIEERREVAERLEVLLESSRFPSQP